MEEGKKELKQWADELVELHHLSNEICQFSNVISACNHFDTGIHIFNGLRELADAVGKEVKLEARDSCDFPFEHYFEYRGAKFYSISGSSDV